MSVVKIETTTMGFRVKVSSHGSIMGSHLMIYPYARKFEQWQYDRNADKWTLRNEFFHIDRVNETFTFPKYDLSNFINYLSQNGVNYTVTDLPVEEGVSCVFHMLPHITYKNDKQKRAVEFLTDDRSGPLRGLGLQTGIGKTVATVMAIQKIGKRAMITMTSRLEQWLNEIMDYTTLTEDEIYIVKGEASLTRLFDLIDKDIHPKIILASTKTIRLYLEYGDGYKHLPHPSEACRYLGLGIIATDEYHEHFYTNFLINILLNAKIFIPITATFMVNDKFSKNVFDNLIPNDVQFTGGDYEKYVNITSYMFRYGALQIRAWDYSGPKGYSQSKFEKYLLSKRGKSVLDAFVSQALIPLTNEHYIQLADKGEKFLFICSTTEFCEFVKETLQKHFTGKRIESFYTGKPTTILSNADMIVSTPGSSGTGRDIKGLICCFVFDCTQSDPRNLQYLGRLRNIKTAKGRLEFIYVSFAAIPKHVEYSVSRSLLYSKRGLTFKCRSIP